MDFSSVQSTIQNTAAIGRKKYVAESTDINQGQKEKNSFQDQTFKMPPMESSQSKSTELLNDLNDSTKDKNEIKMIAQYSM